MPSTVEGSEVVPAPVSEQEQLHSDDILELTAFIERKEWIRDKIKLLESIPPLDIFAGIEQLSNDHQDLRPTREQLAAWVQQHDSIERETDQFDAGDMAKLKKFAKAATQRVLSPRDTDLIEVTLDTLIALDKLLHLLRSRSENLELLTLRLDWEDEWRIGSQSSRAIISDIREFTQHRASWSPLALRDAEPDGIPASQPNHEGAFQSGNEVMIPVRHPWYRQVELLSHEAATFSDRIVALRQNSVVRSGKTLDKLIDLSHTPVPDRILDEQERLENTCNVELDNVSSFLMSIVVQWRKSTEIFSEVKRDQQVAKALQQEINGARSQVPAIALSSAFLSRAGSLLDKANLRSNLQSPASTFPRPKHSLFPGQDENNRFVIDFLTDEMRKTKEMALQTRTAGLAYMQFAHAYVEAGILINDANSLVALLKPLIEDLAGESKDGDGLHATPDFSDLGCFDSSKFAVYISSVPAIRASLDSLEPKVSHLLGMLQKTTAEHEMFVTENGVSLKEQLEIAQRDLREAWHTGALQLSSALTAIAFLEQVSLAWSHCKQFHNEATTVHSILQQEISTSQESEEASVFREAVNSNSLDALERLTEAIAKDITGLDALKSKPCVRHLVVHHKQFRDYIGFLRSLDKLRGSLRGRETALSILRSEMGQLQDSFSRFVSALDESMGHIITDGADRRVEDVEHERKMQLADLQEDLKYFLSTLPGRVPVIDPWPMAWRSELDEVSTSSSKASTLLLSFEPPGVDTDSMNETARSEINSCAAVLSNLARIAEYRTRQLPAALTAHRLRMSLANLEGLIRTINMDLGDLRSALHSWNASTSDQTELPRDIARFSADSRNAIGAGLEEANNLRNQMEKDLGELEGELGSHSAALRSKLESLRQSSGEVLTLVEALRLDCESEVNNRLSKAKAPADSFEIPTTGKVHEIPEPNSTLGTSECPVNQNNRASTSADLWTGNEERGETLLVSEHPPILELEESHSINHADQLKLLRERLQGLPFLHLGEGDHVVTAPKALNQLLRMEADLAAIATAFSSFPSTSQPCLQSNFNALSKDLEISKNNLESVLAFSEAVRKCDTLFSDLVESLDKLQESPEGRDHYLNLLHEMREKTEAEYRKANNSLAARWDVHCIQNELKRLSRVWNELQEMIDEAATNEGKSANNSSGRSSAISSASEFSYPGSRQETASPTATRRRKTHGPFLVPSTPSKRPSVLAAPPLLQSVKKSAQRSVSGPVIGDPFKPNSTLHHSTFASRSRTTSTSSAVNIPQTITPRKMRSVSAQYRRPSSPASSEASTSSRVVRELSKSPSFRVPSRALRTPIRNPASRAEPRGKYVANPTNKLDVAVGNVVNSLSVPVNVEAVSDGWRDQSGKYWIGDSDAKLCFCRILRSQTVMVRVGGGWVELSRFIDDHFADSFRMLSSNSSPPKGDLPWISANTLGSNGSRPQTPEKLPHSVPSFALSTPSKTEGANLSPPLTPLQFMRRADIAPSLPSTPAKVTPRSRLSHGVSASAMAWKP